MELVHGSALGLRYRTAVHLYPLCIRHAARSACSSCQYEARSSGVTSTNVWLLTSPQPENRKVSLTMLMSVPCTICARMPWDPNTEAMRSARRGVAVGSPVRTQSAGVSLTPFNPRHYSAVYTVVPVRINVV